MDLDQQQSQLKLLIAKGKEQGYLTYHEVNDHLPEGIVDPEQIEDIISMINDMGIAVHEVPPDAEAMMLLETTVDSDDDDAEEAAAALAAVYVFFAEPPADGRLVGLGQIDTAIVAGRAFAVVLLVALFVATRDTGPDLFLVGAGESVRRVFELAGLDHALTRCFGCWADFERALAV